MAILPCYYYMPHMVHTYVARDRNPFWLQTKLIALCPFYLNELCNNAYLMITGFWHLMYCG